MPLSRPVLLALIAAILGAAAFMVTQASRQQADPGPVVSPSKPSAKKAVAETKAAPAKAKAAAPAKAKAAKAAAKPTPVKAKTAGGVPPSVARALDQKRVVVLFFRQPGAADDNATAAAVSAQRGRKGVSVFSDSIARLARYRAAVAGLGVSQAPAVVIVGPDGKAQLVEGYVDEGTLTQQVVDAR